MPDTPDGHANRPLQFLDELVREGPAIAGDVAKISDDIWAIHGVIPVDGDVILAEFGSYDEARSVLDQLPAGSHEGCSAQHRRLQLLQAWQGSPELTPRADAQLRVHLAEVVLDGSGADEELGADLRVGPSLYRQAGDLRFLRGEVGTRVQPCAGGRSRRSRAARDGPARRRPRLPCRGTCRRRLEAACGRRAVGSRVAATRRRSGERGPDARRSGCAPAARSPRDRAPRQLSPDATRARERARMPSAQSVPAATARSSSSRNASAATSGEPPWAAASMSSTSAKPRTPSSSCSHAARAPASASS